jgi:polyisoprenoid-binding protein YceI
MKANSKLATLALFFLATSPALAEPRAFDLQHSKMTVHVSKQGVFAFLADNHEIEAPIESGSYDAQAQSVELAVKAADLHVLDPKLPGSSRATVQSNTTGGQVLDAERYPTISFRSTKFTESGTNRWTVAGDLTLHGQTHAVEVHVTKVDSSHFTGSATVAQTAFGITPIRVAGGAVTVKDAVDIDFQIALVP